MSLKTERWHGYIALARIIPNLNEPNWVILIDEMRELIGDGSLPQHKLVERGDLDRFILGTEYSNAYIYEARFRPGAVDFDKFANRLAALFEVDPENISYTTTLGQYDTLLTVVATYQYNASNRIRVALFGCVSDETLCTWAESRQECAAYLAANSADWDEVI